MKTLVFFFVLALIPVCLAYAQEERPVAMTAQIIVRDVDGGLVAYLEVNKIQHLSPVPLHKFLDAEFNPAGDQVFSVNGQDLQLIRRLIDFKADSDSVISDIALNAKIDGNLVDIVQTIHDGIPVHMGDTLTVIWTFIRPA